MDLPSLEMQKRNRKIYWKAMLLFDMNGATTYGLSGIWKPQDPKVIWKDVLYAHFYA